MQSFTLSTVVATAMAAYSGTDFTLNGANWPDLCQTGMQQSPIDLMEFEPSDRLSLDLDDYDDTQGMMVDLGSTVQFNFEDPKYARMMLVRGDGSVSEWVPAQFHYHAPSEHTIGGRQLDLEVHFVHLPRGGPDPEGQGYAAVLGVFFDREMGGNYPNEFIESMRFDQIGAGSETWESGPIPLDDFLDLAEDASFISYDGSLTTPPCTEGIKWTISMDVQPISDEQLEYFTRNYAGNYEFAQGQGNYRLTQPLNGRTVYYHDAGMALYEDMGAASLTAAAVAIMALLHF